MEVKLNRRVQAITATNNQFWRLDFEANGDNKPEAIASKAVIVAIPAPQALMLLEPLAESILPTGFVDKLRSVEFDPCLAVMAGYPSQNQLNIESKAVIFPTNSDLAWICLDSSKRPDSQFPVFVIHSSAEFAKNYLDTEDLNPAAQHLLATAAAELNISWFTSPDWFQIHRWRYAFPSRPLQESFLDSEISLPLICGGDWCGGNLVESALSSGLATAKRVNEKLDNLCLPDISFLDKL